MLRTPALISLFCCFVLVACQDQGKRDHEAKVHRKKRVQNQDKTESIGLKTLIQADKTKDDPKPKQAEKLELDFPEAKESEIVRFDGDLSAILTAGAERVEVEAELISGQSRPLEFLVVGLGGAVHEALLRIWAKASHLKDALELIGCVEGKTKISRRGADEMPTGEKVIISLRWEDAAGKTRYARIEDWVANRHTKTSMTRGPWIFAGGRSAYREDIQRDTYEPDWTGNIIATWRDPSCVIDNPRPYAVDSTAYSVNNRGGMPSPDTPVTMIIQRAAK